MSCINEDTVHSQIMLVGTANVVFAQQSAIFVHF